MAGTADQVIEALHAGHDQLVPIVQGLTPEQLTTPTTPGEWDLSQVISHLGSGAEITRAGIEAALAGAPRPDRDADRAVWAVWDARSPQERADEFVASDPALLAVHDGIDAPTREALRIDMGFRPAPVDLATAATFRLDEAALHSWDVQGVPGLLRSPT